MHMTKLRLLGLDRTGAVDFDAVVTQGVDQSGEPSLPVSAEFDK
jgi:hypothetical protein